LPFCCSLTYRFSHYNFACAKSGQHDGHLLFWLPAINPLFISLSLHVLLAVHEINGIRLCISLLLPARVSHAWKAGIVLSGVRVSDCPRTNGKTIDPKLI